MGFSAGWTVAYRRGVTSDGKNTRESTSDPFAVLGVARQFNLADAEIEAAFLARLGGIHPDLAGEDASLDAAVLTEARGVLMDPERRAGALLALLGGPSASQDRSLPDGFLIEMMELRQEIESELEGAGDEAEGDRGARSRWASFAEERRRGHIERVAALFAGVGGSGGAGGTEGLPDALTRVREELNAWRYTERLIEQLDPGYDPARADFPG